METKRRKTGYDYGSKCEV